MGKEFQVELETEGFQRMLDDMDRHIKGVSYDDILRAEVGSVLSKAASLTKKAKEGLIEQHIRDNAPPANKKGWYKPDGQNARRREWRLKSSEWSAYKKYHNARIKEARARAGLAAQAWVQIGEQLKIAVKAAKGVQRAKVDGQKIKHEGTSGTRSEKGQHSISYTLRYGNPVGAHAKTTRALRRAMKGRESFYRRNLKEGVFASARSIAKKYPGIIAKP